MWAAASVVLGIVMAVTVDWRVTVGAVILGAVWWYWPDKSDPP